MLGNSTLLRLVKAVIVLLLVASGVCSSYSVCSKCTQREKVKPCSVSACFSLSVGYRRTSTIDVASDASLEKFLPSEEPIQVK